MAARPEEARSGMRRYEVKVAQDIMGVVEGGGAGGCDMCCMGFVVTFLRVLRIAQVTWSSGRSVEIV